MQKARLFHYRDIFDLKIMQSDWPRAFWSISQETDFSQILHLYSNIANSTFIIGEFQEKTNDQIFQ